ncbi:MAG TPA: hydrogenase maturation protease [Chloroflexota bacterium]
MSRVLVIGIGNAYHGDDAAGLEIARRVRDACLGGVMVEECSEDMVELLDAWQDSDVVVLIDAVQSGSPLGTIFRFDALAEVLPSCFVRQVSSHGIGMPESIELARALDRLPRNLIVYGVEGALFELGAALSPEVEAVLDTAADRIVGELRSSEQPPEASGAA